MAEPLERKQFTISYAELTELLIKRSDIHTGHWGILITFGMSVTNYKLGGGQMLPTAVLPIMSIGIQNSPVPNELTVDAAKVNPQPSRKKRKTRKKP